MAYMAIQAPALLGQPPSPGAAQPGLVTRTRRCKTHPPSGPSCVDWRQVKVWLLLLLDPAFLAMQMSIINWISSINIHLL